MDSTREQAIETLKNWADNEIAVGLTYNGTGVLAELSGRLRLSESTIVLSSESGNIFSVELVGTEDITLIDLKVRETKSPLDSGEAVVSKAVQIELTFERITIFEWIPGSGPIQ